MIHLLAGLMRLHDPRIVALVLVEALLGSGAAMHILLDRSGSRRGGIRSIGCFGLAITVTSCLTFRTALSGSFEHLALVVPLAWAAPALLLSALSAIAAGTIQTRGRRSARNAMLAGSLLACGFSCMLFIAMAGLVAPFALAYDLTAVLVIMVLGGLLCAFSLWEGSNPARHRPWLVSTGFMAFATVGLAFGSVAAILPFADWMDALGRPDNLSFSPIVVILAAEGVAMLLLSLLGSLVDNRVAARDLIEVQRIRELADSTLEGILIHAGGKILDANRSLADLLGIALCDLRRSQVASLLPPDAEGSLWNGEQDITAAETDIVAPDGNRIPVEILTRRISHGGQPALVTALRDVRERRATEKQIRFLAHHDVLTKLPNRALLGESLEQSLRLATRNHLPLAVLCLDLDGFKLVNDTLGHAAGDQLLCQVADRLRATLRDTDFVARIGGDEFVVLQTTGALPEHAAVLATRIINCLTSSFQIDDQDVNVGTSIGIAFYPQDGETSQSLLKKADIALYRAKESGRGWFCLFEEGMDLALRERRGLEQDLRVALQREEFTLNFQPLFDRDRTLIAFEALIRWTHPTLGPMSPAHFIPLAEECGLMIPLGEWILHTACLAAVRWSRHCRVAVNLSPAQLLRSDVPALVSKILAETGLAPERLELEITEGVLIDNVERTVAVLNALREVGIRIVLDDFGTGYSSLSYLHRFSFDKLKIDRSFVQRLEGDQNSRAIVNAIISMSRNLNLDVTAEGVETVEQFELLRDKGCHEFQGFLLGRPMAEERIEPFIQAHLLEQARIRSLPVREDITIKLAAD